CLPLALAESTDGAHDRLEGRVVIDTLQDARGRLSSYSSSGPTVDYRLATGELGNRLNRDVVLARREHIRVGHSQHGARVMKRALGRTAEVARVGLREVVEQVGSERCQLASEGAYRVAASGCDDELVREV